MRIASAAIILAGALAGINACSSSTAPPATGSLLLTVSGLPGAGAGAVTVTGPGGYHASVTVTTTLVALVPGTYTIAAFNVFTAGATYGLALASQVVEVTASNTAVPATVTYAVLPSGWTTSTSMPTARDYLAAGVVNGILYAVGGSWSSGSLTGFASEAYDPVTNTWTTKAAMPTARGGLAAGVVNGILYAVGGGDGAGASNTVEAYDPVTNTWTTKPAMPTARYAPAVGVVNGILYAVGGGDAGSALAVVEAYTP